MKLQREMYQDYYFDVATKLLLTPSPSGYYEKVMEVVKRHYWFISLRTQTLQKK